MATAATYTTAATAATAAVCIIAAAAAALPNPNADPPPLSPPFHIATLAHTLHIYIYM